MGTRRRHHHSLQPYDYERFAPQRDRDQPSSRGIEYQDDSLSSINSDEETYLQKDKGKDYYQKNKSKDKSNDYHKEPVSKSTTAPQQTNITPVQTIPPLIVTEPSSSTNERLNRLESMLEQLIKNSTPAALAPTPVAPPATVATVSAVVVPPIDRPQGDSRYHLEARRHDFTTSMWINKIEEVAIQNNWNEKSIIKYMEGRMSGIVKTWFNCLPNCDYTWPEWKLLISKTFPDNTDFVTSLKRLVTRLKQPDETITNYYFSKMYLIEACKITGEDAVSCLIDGLNNTRIQEQAKTQNYLTPETLYSQFLSVLTDYTVDYAPQINQVDTVDNGGWYYPGPNAVEEAQVEELHFEKPNRSSAEYEGDYDGVPLKRQAPVHSRLDKRFMKPAFKPYVKGPLASMICDICGKRGHLGRNCRTKMMCCKLVTDGVVKDKICTINGRKRAALIDTGSPAVTMKWRVTRDLRLKKRDWLLEGFGGGRTRALGEVTVNVEVDGIRRHVNAIVVKDDVQDYDVVIGRNFLDNVTMRISQGQVFLGQDVAF